MYVFILPYTLAAPLLSSPLYFFVSREKRMNPPCLLSGETKTHCSGSVGLHAPIRQTMQTKQSHKSVSGIAGIQQVAVPSRAYPEPFQQECI
jgi:hypothetical protein